MGTALTSRRWFMVVAVLAAGTVGSAQEKLVAPELSGSWSGTWQSCKTRHHGPLNATFCKLDDLHYQVNFSGRFFKIIPFHYSVTLTVVEQQGDKLILSGSNYLGRRYGTFYYRAEATSCSFVAHYTSCKDNGRFDLTRCCTSCGH